MTTVVLKVHRNLSVQYRDDDCPKLIQNPIQSMVTKRMNEANFAYIFERILVVLAAGVFQT